MRTIPVAIVLTLIILFSSIVTIKSLKAQKYSILRKAILSVDILFLISFFTMLIINSIDRYLIPMRATSWYIWAAFTVYAPLLFYSIFCSIDWIISMLRKKETKVIKYIGASLAILTVVVMITGMLSRNYIQVREITLQYPNLPAAFDGIRIAHITDLHIGALSPEKAYLEKIEQKIDEQNADMLVFTGDMLNLSYKDGEHHSSLFNSINPPLGKYAVLGNHDYGMYAGLSGDEYTENMHLTKGLFASMGFTLLCDSSTKITKDSASIHIIGTENCGKVHFPCYSDLETIKALTKEENFNIVLSHDPNYWLYHVPTDLTFADLTLSGHTHSAQIGIDMWGIKLSPSALIFKAWDGLYSTHAITSNSQISKDNYKSNKLAQTSNTADYSKTSDYSNITHQNTQHNTSTSLRDNLHLFVSRGIGYVGIPFRLGMPSEITIITLKSTHNHSAHH